MLEEIDADVQNLLFKIDGSKSNAPFWPHLNLLPRSLFDEFNNDSSVERFFIEAYTPNDVVKGYQCAGTKDKKY